MLKRIPSSVLLGVANLTDVASSLVRGVALAHILSPEQFGLAITVSVVAGIVDLVTDLGVTPLAVRSNSAEELNTLHTISILRGGIIGLIIAASAPIFASIFHAPQTIPAYMIVGLSSAVRGLANLDLEARARQYDYAPKVVALIVSQVVWTAVSIYYARLTHDFLAMAVGVLSFMLSYVILSHMLSGSRWRLAWHRPTAVESWRYGRLLALNGIANAVSSLGDRALTGAAVGLAQLAHYTALTTSALLPKAALARYLGSVFTPHFVNASDTSREHVSHLWVITVAAIGGVFGFGFIAFGRPVTSFVYGSRYEVEQTLVGLVALLGAIRYMGCLPTPPVLAYGRNELLIRYTILSMSGLALGAVLLLLAHRLELLIAGMCVGETASMMWLLLHMRPVLPVPRSLLLKAIIGPILLIAGTVAATVLLNGNDPLTRAIVCTIGAMLYAALMRVVMVEAGCSMTELVRAVVPSKTVQKMAAE